jgi:predicted RNase H-like HicB family nuclease
MQVVNIPVTVSYEEDTYIARCPLLQGAFAEGETPEEAIKELVGVVKMILEYRKERKEKTDGLKDFVLGAHEKVCTSIPVAV